MEKNFYPQVPDLPGVPDAPPTYNNAMNAPPTVPSSEFVPMASREPMPGYMPEPQQQSSFAPSPQTVYIQSPAIPPLGPKPCSVICPSCHQQQQSTVRYENSSKTHLFALLMCVLGLVCCFCMPYCMDTCKNANHYCSNCNAYLGVYNK